MPVRLTIHASSTPMRSAIGPFGTTSAGTWWPRPMTRAVRAGASPSPLRVASRAIVASSGGSAALRMGRLRGEDALVQAGEDLARPGLDEVGGAGGAQGEHGLAPADRLGDGGGELGPDVAERP